jgi:hypothetical protein
VIKKGEAAVDYAVMPLEGLWWVEDMAQFSIEDKDGWKWTAMIMQPEYVTLASLAEARDRVEKNKDLVALPSVRFETFYEGRAVQIIHKGPFTQEGPTIDKLHRFIEEQGHERRGKHHEIYLSDPRRTAPERLRTAIRQPFGSIGASEEVVADVIRDPTLFDVVFGGMLGEDPLVRMRCADTVEKITATHPEYLRPYKEKLISQVAGVEQQEVRWYVAQMLPRLDLNADERAATFSVLLGYLNDPSRIVKTCAMQALADLAGNDASLQPRVIDLLEDLTRTGSPAMQSRGTKLLDRLRRSADG